MQNIIKFQGPGSERFQKLKNDEDTHLQLMKELDEQRKKDEDRKKPFCHSQFWNFDRFEAHGNCGCDPHLHAVCAEQEAIKGMSGEMKVLISSLLRINPEERAGWEKCGRRNDSNLSLLIKTIWV
jgi:hypothetical protein